MRYLTLFLVALAIFTVQGEPNAPKITGKGGFIQKSVEFVKSNNKEFDYEDGDLDIFDINANSHDLGLIDGDVIPQAQERSAVNDVSRYWPTTLIPVAYGQSLPLLAQAGIDEARLEYEMRTCIRYIDRTDEDSFILFRPLSGCFSSIGCLGIPQQISIGSGCEKHGTVQHELMHALGIYHQQSRPDRDNYVNIELQNIQEGTENNFNKYDFNTVDDKRVPYDYESVMHYSDQGFSINGQPTIVTKDPAFQFVIGQRRTFSEGDVQMINTMYPCGDPLRHSFSCGFEVENECGYTQQTDDDMNFVQTAVADIPTLGTDNTFGQKNEGTVMLLESSGVGTANMASMRMTTNSSEQCLRYSYYMNLNQDNQRAEISVSLGEIDEVTGEIISLQRLDSIKNDHGDYWNLERLTFYAPAKHYKLVFSATNSDIKDVIAIDDIQIQDRACDTTYVQVHDYTQVYNSVEEGDAIFTDTMYTDDGYAFQLKMYPRGREGRDGTYFSVYFGLVPGVNDDELQWPFLNRHVRVQMEDQDADVRISMNQFYQYLTESDQGDGTLWDKPTEGGDFKQLGFSSFIRNSDLFETKNFLKNDAIVLSIQIRDMTNAPQRGNIGDIFETPGELSFTVESSNSSFVPPSLPPPEPESDSAAEGLISFSSAIAVALVSSFLVFLMMATVLLCISNSHQKSINAITKVTAKRNTIKDVETFHNLNYLENEEKV